MTRANAGPAESAGVLTVAVAPVGHGADASARLGPALASARLIAAADPGRLRELAAELGVTLVGRVVRYPGDAGAGSVAAPPAADLLRGPGASRAPDLPPAPGAAPAPGEPDLPPAPGASPAPGEPDLSRAPGVPAVPGVPPAPGEPDESRAPGASPAPGEPDLSRAAGAPPTRGLLAELLAGRDVLLVTGAGVAGGRDPAGQLVAAAADAGIFVTVLPGASPITTALAVSGLPGDRFVVEGFLPQGSRDRERRLAELAAERRTLLFVDSPPRIRATLAGLAAAFGADRRAAVCPEPGTRGAGVLRGTLGELRGRLTESGLAGDVTVVVAGAAAPESGIALSDAVALVRARVLAGATTKDAVAAVATATGLRRRDLYNAAARDSAAASAGHST